MKISCMCTFNISYAHCWWIYFFIQNFLFISFCFIIFYFILFIFFYFNSIYFLFIFEGCGVRIRTRDWTALQQSGMLTSQPCLTPWCSYVSMGGCRCGPYSDFFPREIRGFISPPFCIVFYFSPVIFFKFVSHTEYHKRDLSIVTTFSKFHLDGQSLFNA